MPITDISRDWGVSPSIVRIITTDTIAAIQVAGYFATQSAAVNDINKGTWEWAPSDVAAIKCSDGQGFFIYDSATSSFVVDVPIGNDFATRELDNLQNTAVNSAIVPNVDNTQDLGSVNIGWANLYAYSVQMPAIDTFTLNISAYDTLGDAYTPFILLTAGNPPACELLDGVTATTQPPGDNSTKLATTAYVDASIAADTRGLLTVSVPISSAQFKALYSTPLLMVTTTAGNYIRIESAILHMLGGGTLAYANGGAILLQYGNTVHGGGVAASNTIAAATVIAWGTTASIVLTDGVLANNAMAAISNLGVFLSCQTGDFTTGDADFVLDISYSMFSAT